jgi:hypothetical protein
MRKITITAALILAAPAAGLAADSFFQKYIAERDGAAPCYARTYDAEHLAANPKQRVRRIFVIHSDIDDLHPPKSFEVLFGFKLRGSKDSFTSEAGCSATRAGAECSVEGDGGTFKLSPDSGGGLLLTNDDRLQLEGSESFSPDLAKGGDDRLLILYPSPAEECSFGDGGEGSTGAEEETPPAVDPLVPTLERPPYASRE